MADRPFSNRRAAFAAVVALLAGTSAIKADPSDRTDDATALAETQQNQSDEWNPRRPQVTLAQGWLKTLGYNPGDSLGAVTEETRLALRLYQRDNQLSENGRLTRKVYEHLKAAAEAVAPDSPSTTTEAAREPATRSGPREGASAAPDKPVSDAATAPRTQPMATDEAAADAAALPSADETASTTAAFDNATLSPSAIEPETSSATVREGLPAPDAKTPTGDASAQVPAGAARPETRTGHVSSDPSVQPTPGVIDLTPTIDASRDEETATDQTAASAEQTQTAMIAPQRIELCASPASGSWTIKDESGSEFAITLRGDGTVSGPSYPQYWSWRPTDLGVEISYDNGMGQRVVRHGAVRSEAAIAGEASDSRGRTWSWTAMRPTGSAADRACRSAGPA